MKNYKKLNYQDLSQEEYKVKSYIDSLNLHQARNMIRLRAQVFKYVKFNFQSDAQFSKENWLCECQKGIQSQRHLQICELYAKIRTKHSLDEECGLVNYFDEILRMNEN